MFPKKMTAIVAAGVLAITLTACGSSTDEGSSSSSSAPMATSEEMAPSSEAMTSEEMTSEEMSSGMDPAADLVGAGCADYAAAVPDGAGSVGGMAQDPVATAASNNPLLTTLVAAVSGKLNPKVDLVSTLNSSEFTVFAPVDDAFAKIDAATLETLKTDDALLSQILTYHVVPGRLDPSQVVGKQTTVEGGTVEVTGSGDNLKVNDATVICGGVQTANATVYLIDTVLMPGAETATSSEPMASGTVDPASTLVGAGCADYAAAVPSGAGSVGGMAQDPVATAASNNPLLKTLVQAVSGQLNPKVDLVSTLNSAEFTVFAPVDDAFAKIDPATIETLKTDDALLSKILTYHVVPGRLNPADIVGEQTTVEGGTVEVAGSGDNLTVNGATVICGGVQTANATVYLIDTVLMPTS